MTYYSRVICIVCVFFVGCREINQSNNAQSDYITCLTNSIENADRVEVVEHSWLGDFTPDERPDDWMLEYKKKTLSTHDREVFIQQIQRLKSDLEPSVNIALTEPHYTIILWKNDQQSSIIQLAPVEKTCVWSGTKKNQPSDLSSIVCKFLKRLGFSVDSSSEAWRRRLKSFQKRVPERFQSVNCEFE